MESSAGADGGDHVNVVVPEVLDQDLQDPAVPILGGHVERSEAGGVPLREAGAVMDQHPGGLLVPALAGEVEGSVPGLVPLPHPPTLLDHQPHRLGLAVPGRQVEDGPPPAVPHLARPRPHHLGQVDQGQGGGEAVGGHLWSEVSQQETSGGR